MTKVTPYFNSIGEDCVIVLNDDGTTWSGLKSAYDTLVSDSSTLASELSNPSTPQAGE